MAKRDPANSDPAMDAPAKNAVAKAVTKNEWANLSDAQMARRLGKALGVGFVSNAEVGLGGGGAGLAEVRKDSWVALEIELKHTHPTENLVQYWPWLERNRRRLVLIHAIAPEARKRRGHRTDLTKWLGATMERVLPGRFTYCRLELGTAEEAAQIENAIAAIATLRTSIHKRKLAPGL